MNDNKKLSSDEIEKLKFEYERLHSEKIKNTNMSYQIMAIFIPISAGFLTYIIKNYSSLSDKTLNAIALISILPLFIAYLIDRRLTYTNQIMNARIEQIENTPGFKMWISRLFNEKDCMNDNPALKEMIREKREKYRGPYGIYKELHVHHFFGGYIVFFGIFLLILMFYKKLPSIYYYFLSFVVFLFVTIIITSIIIYILLDFKKSK